MAATDTGKYANIYTRTGGNDSVNVEVSTPDATADLTAFRAIAASMAGAGKIGVQINGTTYVIPLLTNA